MDVVTRYTLGVYSQDGGVVVRLFVHRVPGTHSVYTVKTVVVRGLLV